MHIIHKRSTTSTNDDAAILAKDGCSHLTTVVTDFQTAGRGRRGKQWFAPPGSNLLFSIVLRPTCDSRWWTRIPQIAGMHMIRTIEDKFRPDADIRLKWPNDLYHRDRKWGGILVESNLGSNPFAILGMGVNCRGLYLDYPADLRVSVSTLEQIFPELEVDPMELLVSFCQRLGETLDDLLTDFSPVIDFVNDRDYLLGKKVTVEARNEPVTGLANGIDENGELILKQSCGESRRISSGSILAIDS